LADLSTIADATLVPTVVLTAIGGSESSDETPLEGLLRRVQGRKLLLILDNYEHLIQACAELVDTMLCTTPDLHVLATSREALRLPSETTWRVPSLAVPDALGQTDPEHVLECGSVKLLVDRILQVEPDFPLNSRNTTTMAKICQRLDGIPLAIELAAARVAAMSVQDIAQRLDDCFQLLTGGTRVALDRHRTLRATIDWSHQLLPENERMLFRRLAIFAGGWTLEAAQVVCSDDRLPRAEILDTLIRLVDQSLVTVQVMEGGTRYRFLEHPADARQVVGRHDGVACSSNEHRLGPIETRTLLRVMVVVLPGETPNARSMPDRPVSRILGSSSRICRVPKSRKASLIGVWRNVLGETSLKTLLLASMHTRGCFRLRVQPSETCCANTAERRGSR